jgi:hypothetical protein
MANQKIQVVQESETPAKWVYRVEVMDGAERHVFTVSLSKAYHRELTSGRMVPLILIQQAFIFLLQRELAHTILTEFDVKQIIDYFPEFESEIRAYATRETK